MTPQNPHIRKSLVCPCCGKEKALGLVLCWPCHDTLTDEHNGEYGSKAETAIAEREGYLRAKSMFRGVAS